MMWESLALLSCVGGGNLYDRPLVPCCVIFYVLLLVHTSFIIPLEAGTTVILCGIAAALLGSNIHTPTLMLANFVAMPIELSLVVPFLRLGEVITGGDHFALTSDALRMVITGQASRDVLLSVSHVMLGWLVAAPFILVVLYFVFIPCFKFLVHKFSSQPPSPKKTHHPHPEPKPKIRDV